MFGACIYCCYQVSWAGCAHRSLPGHAALSCGQRVLHVLHIEVQVQVGQQHQTCRSSAQRWSVCSWQSRRSTVCASTLCRQVILCFQGTQPAACVTGLGACTHKTTRQVMCMTFLAGRWADGRVKPHHSLNHSPVVHVRAWYGSGKGARWPTCQ